MLHRIAWIVPVLFAAVVMSPPAWAADAERPNILWLSTEDIGPHIGPYGEPAARTPNLDAFADRALTYNIAWSDAPVCAPARTAIISGMSPPSIGGQHMRSHATLPDGALMFPQYLRDAGYYTTNNSKEDYNLRKTGKVWDASNNNAHYRDREEGQPFFAVFNHTGTHESRVRGERDAVDEIPEQMVVPEHHPDLPAFRRDWASYHRIISRMDGWFGDRLDELEEAGLHEDTIVFFWGDHGAGMPRHKRWPFNSGLHVPLIIYVPPKFDHLAPEEYEAGGRTDRKAAFEDLGPTVLSLAGIEPPDHMDGRPLMGQHEGEPRDYLYGFRGRMDERIDMVRTIRDERYIYIRNYMPHRIYGQHLQYMYLGPVPPAWEAAYDAGELAPPHTFYWEPKPAEELYDLHEDPDEVNNLAYSPEHQQTRRRLKEALKERIFETRDLGFLPEGEIHSRAGDDPPHAMGADPERYPLEPIYATAELAAGRDLADVPELVARLSADDSAVRYWAATGLLIRGQYAVWPHREQLRAAMEDEATPVRVVAAEALGTFGNEADLEQALETLVELGDVSEHDAFTGIAALNALHHLGDRAKPVRSQIESLPRKPAQNAPRASGYQGRLLDKLTEDLGDE